MKFLVRCCGREYVVYAASIDKARKQFEETQLLNQGFSLGDYEIEAVSGELPVFLDDRRKAF
jgi:hypothetical protein